MARPGPRSVRKYSDEFKVTAWANERRLTFELGPPGVLKQLPDS